MEVREDCWHRVTTTFGRLAFPVWAYRERSANTTKTRTPAAALDPLHAHCHSSIFLLEREVRLGSDHSFRVAQQLMLFYSNDAVDIEDTTIAAHTYAVGRMVKRHYLYRSREDTMEVLRTRATIDRETGRPILYVSTDGHILRRFIDETTLGAWKNANGLRLWCVDRYTGEIIHIGGEYTWGNCEVVEKIVKELISEGLLPADGDYGDGLVARIAWVTDGAPWFETRVFPLFPNAVLILDPYHAIDHIAKYAVEAFGLNTPKKRAFMRQVREAVLGATGAPKGKPGKRKGRRKRSEQEKAEERQQQPSRARLVTKDAGPILALLRKVATPGRCKETLNSLVGYITRNAYRMDYAR